MLKVVPDPAGASPSVGQSLLDEFVVDEQMLAAALQAEVTAYVAAHAGEVDDQGSTRQVA